MYKGRFEIFEILEVYMFSKEIQKRETLKSYH